MKNVFAIPTMLSRFIKPKATAVSAAKLAKVNTIREAYFFEKNLGRSPTLPLAVICLETAPTNIKIVHMHKLEARSENMILALSPNIAVKRNWIFISPEFWL